MDELNAKVEQLGRANRNNRILAVVGAVFCVMAMLMLLRSQTLVAAVLVAACLATFFLARETNRSYVEQATQANLKYGLAAGLENFSYTPKGGLSAEQFRELEMFPLAGGKDPLLCRNGFTAQDGNRTFSGQELTFHFQADQGGTAGFHFLSGALIQGKGEGRSTGEDLLLLGDALWEYPEVRRYAQENYRVQPCPLEGYRLFTKGEEAPGKWLLDRLKDLPSTVSALRLTRNQAAVYLGHRFYTGAKYPAAKPTAERLRGNTLEERDALWALFRWWLPSEK